MESGDGMLYGASGEKLLENDERGERWHFHIPVSVTAVRG